MSGEIIGKNTLLNLFFIGLSYSLLVVFLGYFSSTYSIEFLQKSYIFELYYYLQEKSFAGYLITGIWAFLDIFTILTIFTLIYLFSNFLLSKINKNA